MVKAIENVITEKRRHRPQFEIDPVMALALANYMQDEEIRQVSPVLRKALRQFLPAKYIEDARRAMLKQRNGFGKRKRK